MKKTINILAICCLILTLSCQSNTTETSHTDSHEHDEHESSDEHHHEEEEHVNLSELQYNKLNIQLGSISKRPLADYIEANGLLEVPPQNEASVTTVIGANVVAINVIEGDKINKGEVLAYLSHPDLIEKQSQYIQEYHQLQYLSKEYERQKTLYNNQVNSGKEFQKTESEYLSAKTHVASLQAQLQLLNIDSKQILEGNIQKRIALKAPISGYIQKVNIKTGQFVSAETSLFEIVNTDHIHADLMVFEKDAHKVKEGQKVVFKINSRNDKEYEAFIFSVGKNFEENPKVLHCHADIENKTNNLLAGMYINGRIYTSDDEVTALPSDAIAREGDSYFIFRAEKLNNQWKFTPIEVIIGNEYKGWVEIKSPVVDLPREKIVLNSAFYLLAEMKKSEAEHSH